MPDNGTSRPTLTSLGLCDFAGAPTSVSAAPGSTRLLSISLTNDRFNMGFLLCVSLFLCKRVCLFSNSSRLLHAQVRLPHPIVGAQTLVVALQDDAAGFQHVAVVGGLERFGDALLHEQNRETGLLPDLQQLVEDEIGDGG